MSHFDEMTVLLYLDKQLDVERDLEISAHVSACGACRSLLQALQKENIWLQEALASQEEALPARLNGAPESANTWVSWAWVAALAIAAAGIYTVWSGVIDPWMTQAADAGFNQGNVLTMLFFSGAFWKGWDAMQSMMEFLSLASVGDRRLLGVAAALGGDSPVAALFLGASLGMMALSPAANAADVDHGDPNYTLEAGQEVKTDLIVSAEHTRIDGDVDGDLIVASRSITVNGHV